MSRMADGTSPNTVIGTDSTSSASAPRITSGDPRVIALASAIVALVDALAQNMTGTPLDELVPLTREALAARKLEYRPVLRLADAGVLRTVKIGRRRYARASWLAALTERLPAVAMRKAQATAYDLKQDLQQQALRSAARIARRAR